MKKLILISALLFSFNGWAEEEENMVYLNCINNQLSTDNEFVILDLEKMIFSSKVAYDWKMTKNNSYYFAEYTNYPQRQLYTLNRITLELRFTRTALNESLKPDYSQPQPLSSDEYQCERTERI